MAETRTTRSKQMITRLFENEDGTTTPRAANDTKAVIFKFQDDIEIRQDLAELFNGSLPPASTGRAAAAFGLSTTCGNAGNTAVSATVKDLKDSGNKDASSDDVHPSVAREEVQGRLNDILKGEWGGEREFGIGTSLLVEALTAYRISKGRPVDEPRMLEFKEKFKDNTYKKNMMADVGFRTVYEKMKMDKVLTKVGEKSTGAQPAVDPLQ